MTCVKTVKMMKEGVEKAGLKSHYMVQPLAFHTPDCGCQGFIDLVEFPFGKSATITHLVMQLLLYETHTFHASTTSSGIVFCTYAYKKRLL